MPDHQLVALAGELVGDRNGLARIARVVADVELQLLAEHAARLVDVGHGLLGAVLQLRAERGILPRHRPGRRDLGLRLRGTGRHRQRQRASRGQHHPSKHWFTPKNSGCRVACATIGAGRKWSGR